MDSGGHRDGRVLSPTPRRDRPDCLSLLGRRVGMQVAISFPRNPEHKGYVRTITPEEVLALLFPEPASAGNPAASVTAFVRDPHGGLMLASVVPSRTCWRRPGSPAAATAALRSSIPRPAKLSATNWRRSRLPDLANPFRAAEPRGGVRYIWRCAGRRAAAPDGVAI